MSKHHYRQPYDLPGDINICTGKDTSDHNDCNRVYGFGHVDGSNQLLYSLMVSMLTQNPNGIRNSWTDLTIEQVKALHSALGEFMADHESFTSTGTRLTR